MKEYRENDKSDRIIRNLRDISQTMHRLYEGKASQSRILIILHEVQQITQRELTQRLGIQPGSASEVIAKLEHAGLIARTPGETDRRTMDLALTEDGRCLAQRAAKQRKIRHGEMFSCLSENEKDTLLTLLEKINADWEVRYRETAKAVKAQRPHAGHNRNTRIKRR
ncbi:MAG: MarR family transcriptional regulator [Lachnospiraceae bacterium]|nr:MarR family transcriptional regulator [Lachnospiraceae bacterium]